MENKTFLIFLLGFVASNSICKSSKSVNTGLWLDYKVKLR